MSGKVEIDSVKFNYDGEDEPKDVTINYNAKTGDKVDRIHGRPKISKEKYDDNGDSESLKKLMRERIIKLAKEFEEDGEDDGEESDDD